jgi:hypothetical protein
MLPKLTKLGLKYKSKLVDDFWLILMQRFFSFSKTYSFLEFAFTQIGRLSVTKILLFKTGKIFSSPSE